MAVSRELAHVCIVYWPDVIASSHRTCNTLSITGQIDFWAAVRPYLTLSTAVGGLNRSLNPSAEIRVVKGLAVERKFTLCFP